MKKAFLLLTIFFIFLIGCKGKVNGKKSISELTEKEKDSALKIVNKICGSWEIEKKIYQDYSLNGMALGTMTIDCLIDIDTRELFNEIIIWEALSISEINAKVTTHPDNLFLQASDSITISKEKEYYGLKYTKENKFIAIKKINDSILLLVDGRKYEKEN